MTLKFSTLCYLTLLGLLIAPIFSPEVSNTATSGLYAQGVIVVFLVTSALYTGFVDWKQSGYEFVWLKVWLGLYLSTSAINNLIIQFRPGTFAQVLVSWGVVFLLARRIRLRYTYEKYWLFFILMFFISCALFLLGINQITVLPSYRSGTLSVNLGYSVSKHFTGLLGFVLFAFSIDRYMKISKGVIVWAGLLLGLYFAVLSSSRAFLLAVIFFPLFYNYSLKRTARQWPILSAWFIVSFIVLVPLIFGSISAFLPIGVSSFLGLDRGLSVDAGGIYSGREWLWLTHFELFRSDWLWGIGKFSLHDLLPLDILPASSESFFTYVLARDGLFSILNIFIFSSLLNGAWKNNNHFGYALAACMIMFSATLGFTTNLYSFEPFFLYFLYFGSFSIGRRFPLRVQSKPLLRRS